MTCRQRKLKCDELKPYCGLCLRSRRRCGYLTGNGFRHFRVPWTTSDKRDLDGASVSGSETDVLREQGNVWLDIPPQRESREHWPFQIPDHGAVTFVQVLDPFDEDSVSVIGHMNQTWANHVGEFDNVRGSIPIVPDTETEHSIITIDGGNDGHIQDYGDAPARLSEESLQRAPDARISAQPTSLLESEDLVTLHLLRHFTEVPGQW